MSEFISRNVNEHSRGGGPLSTVLKLAAVAVAVAGGALIVSKFNNSNRRTDESGETAQESKDAVLDL